MNDGFPEVDITVAASGGDDDDDDDGDGDDKDEVQRAGRQCTYSSPRCGEESREWQNNGAPSVQLTPIVSNRKIPQKYLFTKSHNLHYYF